MRIRTAADLGAVIRERRVKLGMNQSKLAEKAGTSRKWIAEVEHLVGADPGQPTVLDLMVVALTGRKVAEWASANDVALVRGRLLRECLSVY